MDDVYAKLRIQLELQEWPEVFMFKFIVPNDPEKIAQVSALFDEASDLRLQPSKNGKYVSIGAKELMMDVNSIIDRYKAAAEIEGIISL